MNRNLMFLTPILLLVSACNLEARTINLVVEEKKFEDKHALTQEEKEEVEIKYKPLKYNGDSIKKESPEESFIKTRYNEAKINESNTNLVSSKRTINELTTYLTDELNKKDIEIDDDSSLKITVTIIPVLHKFSGETIPMMVGYQMSDYGKQIESDNYLEVIGYKNIRKYILKGLKKYDDE